MMVVQTRMSISLLEQLLPDPGELLLAHLAVGDHHRRVGDQLPDAWRRSASMVLHPVVQVEDLPAAAQLLADGLGHDMPQSCSMHIGLNRLAVLGRLLDGGHIPDAGHRHIQSARDRGGREGQHVDAVAQLLKLSPCA